MAQDKKDKEDPWGKLSKGEAFLLRVGTLVYRGVVKEITPDFLTLEQVSWIHNEDNGIPENLEERPNWTEEVKRPLRCRNLFLPHQMTGRSGQVLVVSHVRPRSLP
jgi:hypothetical protein